MIRRLGYYTKSMWFKVACAILALLGFYVIAGFLLPVFIAVALTFILFPVVKVFEKWLPGAVDERETNIWAILLTFLLFGIALYLIIAHAVLPLFMEANRLLYTLPPVNAVDVDTFINHSVENGLPSNLVGLFNQALSMLAGYLMEVFRGLLASTFTLATSIIGLVIVPFLTFYFLKDWRLLKEMCLDLFPVQNKLRVARIIRDTTNVLNSYVQGMLILSLMSAFFIFSGTWFLGVDYPLVLGFIALSVEMVPILGPLFGSVPAIFIAYSQNHMLALYVAIFYLIYYQLDSQLFMPNIMGKKINLHPVLIIIGVLIGGKLFGLMGLVFAVPVLAVGKVFYSHLWHLDEEEKN